MVDDRLLFQIHTKTDYMDNKIWSSFLHGNIYQPSHTEVKDPNQTSRRENIENC